MKKFWHCNKETKIEEEISAKEIKNPIFARP